MPRSEELNKQAIALLEEARALKEKVDKTATAEKRDATNEEKQTYLAALAKHKEARDAATAAADEERQFAEAESWAKESAGRKADPNTDKNTDGGSERDRKTGKASDEDMGRAFRAWACINARKASLVSEDDIRAAKRLGVNLGDNELGIRCIDTDSIKRRQRFFQTMHPARAYEESRALTTQVGQTGGFSIAPLFNASIESAMLYYGPMMQTSEIIRTATGAPLPFMTDNETSKTGSYVGENTAITTAEGVTLNVTTMTSYKGTTNAILIPSELFRDSAINLNAYIADKLGERLGRFINTETTTGAIKVRGITNRSTSGKTTASSTAITFDEILGLKHSVDIAYRNGASWMMHDSIALIVRLLKTGTGEYLWSNGAQAGQPDRLDGHPVFINNDMASSLTSGAKSIEFGQLNKYKIRMVEDIRITMTDQLYWASDQIGVAAYVHFDGDLIDAGTHPVKHMTQV